MIKEETDFSDVSIEDEVTSPIIRPPIMPGDDTQGIIVEMWSQHNGGDLTGCASCQLLTGIYTPILHHTARQVEECRRRYEEAVRDTIAGS